MHPPGKNRESLDQMVDRLRNARHHLADEVSVNDNTIRQLWSMFDKVFKIFDELWLQNIHLRRNNGLSERITSGRTLRAAGNKSTVPSVLVHLDPASTLTIVPAMQANTNYPENVFTARFRCKLICNGAELDSVLVDNKDSLAEWIIKTVLYYEVQPIDMLPNLPGEPLPPATDPIGRNPRAIMLDDDLNEES